MNGYSQGSVSSADATVIGYRRLGSGPAVILLHGGMQAAQHLMKLAGALSGEFTVYVPDRRGRGLSGPHGDDYSVTREVEDVQALVTATGASRIFGLSSGGLVALATARVTPVLDRVALYEPPLSVHWSVPTDWVPRYEREIASGETAAAVVTVLKGLGVEPVLGRIPRFVLTPLTPIALRAAQRELPEDDVSIEKLAPTHHYDMQLIREMADTAKDYTALGSQVLLLDGAKSPAYLHLAVDALSAVLPHARRITFPGLRHSGPDDDGAPSRVAEPLRDFFK
jgi:pimeloyl-ACP methyl ester carboxylesterase